MMELALEPLQVPYEAPLKHFRDGLRLSATIDRLRLG